MRQVVRIFTDCEIVILDQVLRLRLGRRHKVLFVHFAHRLTELVSNYMPIADLLVDCRVVNQSAIQVCRRLLVLWQYRRVLTHHQISCHLSILDPSGTGSTDYPIVHQLQVLVGLVLAPDRFTCRVAHDEFVCWDAVMIRAIHRGTSPER